MPEPRFEVPSGVIDGVNTVYTVSTAYQPGSVAVFLNGQLKTRLLDDGWTETSPAAGTVTLSEAPKEIGLCPDVVQIFFLDTSPAAVETSVERIKGKLRTSQGVRGVLRDAVHARAKLVTVEDIKGTVVDRSVFKGRVQTFARVHGRLRSCDVDLG
jgi:hypothetical protein